MDFSEAGELRLPFGKYCGLSIDKVASTNEGLRYLDWLIGQEWLKDRLKDALATYLGDETIKKEVEQAIRDRE